MSKLMAFWRDEEGATAIEYGLIAGLIAIAIVAVVGDIGGELNRIFGLIFDELEGVTGS